MNLRTRTARTCVAHFPEIVLLVAKEDSVLREVFLPSLHSLNVESCAISLRTLEYCSIESLLVELVNLSEKLPSPVDCLNLEVITEAPVSEHLEHCMVICVAADLLKVVVLTAHAKTFLAVCDSFPLCRAVAEEPILELVHTGICEHKSRVVLYDHRCRWHDLMTLRSEEVKECFSNFLRCHIYTLLFLHLKMSRPPFGGRIAAHKLQLAKIQKISVMCACDQPKWCRYIYNSSYIFPLLRLYIMLI